MFSTSAQFVFNKFRKNDRNSSDKCSSESIEPVGGQPDPSLSVT